MSGIVLRSQGIAPTTLVESGWKAALEPTASTGLLEGEAPSWQRVAIISSALVLFVACVLQLSLQVLLAGQFYPGVKLGGVDLGGKSYREAAAQLGAIAPVDADHRKLQVSAGGKTTTLTLKELGARFDANASLDAAYSVGRDSWWALGGLQQAKRDGAVDYKVAIDREVMMSSVRTLVAGVGAAPLDAKVVIDAGVPRIEADRPGTAVNPDTLANQIEQALQQTNPPLVEAKPEPQQAAIRASALGSAVEETKRLLATSITLSAGARKYTPSPAEIGAWINFTPETKEGVATLRPGIDQPKLQAYIATIAAKVDVAAVNKQVNVENGITKSQTEGKDGTAIDRVALAAQLSDAVMNKRALTAAVPMQPVPFKTLYNRTTVLDVPKYIEINLSTQRLWAYQDHNVVYQSNITSGATRYGFGTSTGMFNIYGKRTNTHLRGQQYGPAYDYDVFVKYWMPFNGGEGLHDASWRSSFGGQDYVYSGSHGCVNLPDAAAAWIYNWAEIGTTVWVHY